MKRFRLNRRDVLRGAGSIAIALPWLEAMRPEANANAAPEVAKRFVAVYQPGGAEQARWRPSGNETSFTLSELLAPLEVVRQKLLVINGMNMDSAVGEQHQAGILALLTGQAQGAAGDFVDGPSVDQAIAPIASAGKARQSIEMAVRWATGKSHGNLHAINALNFSENGPIPPRLDPQEIFDTLFGTLDPGDGTMDDAVTAARERKLSILDFVDRRYETLAAKLGANDRQRLQQHLTYVRELETSLQSNGGGGSTGCMVPERADTTGYNPTSGLNSSDNGSIVDSASDEMIPVVGKFMMDMLVMALQCDMTGVATLQWTDTEAKHTFPWLSLSEHHHFYQHDGGFASAECAKIDVWYAEQHAYLLQQMDQVDMGGHTLLDESVVFFGSEISHPPTHTKTDMPFLLAGGGGGLSGNRWLDFNNRSHNDLLSAILNLFGDPSTTFGDAEFAGTPVTDRLRG